MTTTQNQTFNPETVRLSEQLPYESNAVPQSHPDRLATVARLFGIKTAPPEQCRVLELACASGGNLVPMAYSLPNSQFVGIDVSQRQTASARSALRALGLKNVEIRDMDIMEVDSAVGTFDYIIVHGLYSWVPEHVQSKILEICRDNLTANGVAYISYNTYPGWHFRGMIRDMMRYHTDQFADASVRAIQARALLDFLAQSVPTQDNAYGMMLKNELDLLRQYRDTDLIHEHLREVNEPLYFHQFADRAGRHGLQYLGEAEVSTMLTSNFPSQVGEILQRISNEIIRTEQYMDFVRNRTFRQTLLCRQEISLNRNLTYKDVLSFWVSSPAKAVSDKFDLQSTQPETFALPTGVTLSTALPLAKAAFQYLGEIWPQSVQFGELFNTARARLSSVSIQDTSSFEIQAQLLGTDLLMGYMANTVLFRTQKAPFQTEVSEKPRASAVARFQAEQGTNRVTNQLHESLGIDMFGTQLIRLLDGSRDKAAILEELAKLVKDGVIIVQKDGRIINGGRGLQDVLTEALNDSLQRMANAAVLIA